jgi:hypothetical protein
MNRCDTLFSRFLRGIQRSMSIMVLLSVGFVPARTMAARLSFKLHYIDQDTAWATSAMQMSLADLNHDGRLDWTVGNVYTNPNFCWYEYQAPDRWVKHTILLNVFLPASTVRNIRQRPEPRKTPVSAPYAGSLPSAAGRAHPLECYLFRAIVGAAEIHLAS